MREGGMRYTVGVADSPEEKTRTSACTMAEDDRSIAGSWILRNSRSVNASRTCGGVARISGSLDGKTARGRVVSAAGTVSGASAGETVLMLQALPAMS